MNKLTPAYLQVFSRHYGKHTTVFFSFSYSNSIKSRSCHSHFIDVEIQFLKDEKNWPESAPLVKDRPHSSTLICI